jgi:hypothetical protein
MMKQAFPIHDLFIHTLEASEEEGRTTLPLLSFDDHLLRRFGFAESITFEPNHRSRMRVRSVADEVWACVNGRVLVRWHDLRNDSPTHDIHHEMIIEESTLMLVPFGVGFGVQTYEDTVHMVRFSTHPEGFHEGDHDVPWEKD